MKVHIHYKTTATPSGGGNQFLRILDNVFSENGVRAKNLNDSDVVLFNSHQFMNRVAAAKRKYPEKLFVHRIDGPMKIYNSISDKRDDIVGLAASLISDGTIFQSEWSREENYRLGLHQNMFDTVINNSVDPDIFNCMGRKKFFGLEKIRLVAVSWSSNPNKGFDVYEWLDKNLDFSRYEMSFIGNSPVNFKNINHIEPMDSKNLAKTLKQYDILIFASKYEACSNTLLEALHCGLPSVVYNFSSNPEVVGDSGELFGKKEDIPECLDRIIENYKDYQGNISLPSIQDVANQYLGFMKMIYNKAEREEYTLKSISLFGLTKIICRLGLYKCYEKIRTC
ncbi:glycosyltransferase [Thermodesulfobacteriota bacterium]